MPTNKKASPKQKLALERIYRLFELASEMNTGKRADKEKYVKRYLSLAKRIGEKTNVSIPKEIMKKFCKKCYSMEVSSSKDGGFLVVKCKACGAERKYSGK